MTMEEKKITIRCRNNDQVVEVPAGSTMQEVYERCKLQMEYGPIAAKVNNKVEGMHYRVYKRKDIKFLDVRLRLPLTT